MDAPVTMLVSADMAIVNSKVKIEFSCNKADCKSYSLCRRREWSKVKNMLLPMCSVMRQISVAKDGRSSLSRLNRCNRSRTFPQSSATFFIRSSFSRLCQRYICHFQDT